MIKTTEGKSTLNCHSRGQICRLGKDSAIVRRGGKTAMGVEPEYMVVEGKTFIKEQLTLDNHVFKNCTMEECQIYYSGGPYELIDTHITNSQLILNQPARNIHAAIQIFKMKSPGSRIVID